MLYLIPFLHQTTTDFDYETLIKGCILFHFYIKPQRLVHVVGNAGSCILFHFYIKPQLHCCCLLLTLSCILFHFYIKPQPTFVSIYRHTVVSYSISTSNHNSVGDVVKIGTVVSYSISTSNHNNPYVSVRRRSVVSYSISTSNHNLWRIRRYFQAHYHLNHILIFNGML